MLGGLAAKLGEHPRLYEQHEHQAHSHRQECAATAVPIEATQHEYHEHKATGDDEEELVLGQHACGGSQRQKDRGATRPGRRPLAIGDLHDQPEEQDAEQRLERVHASHARRSAHHWADRPDQNDQGGGDRVAQQAPRQAKQGSAGEDVDEKVERGPSPEPHPEDEHPHVQN